MKKVVTFVSCIGDVNDTHTVKFMKSLVRHGFTVQSIRCGLLNDSNIKHYQLPDVKANFWPNGTSFVNICSAIIQRLRNSLLLFRYLIASRPDIVVATEPDSWVVCVVYKSFAKVRVIGELREVYEDRVDAFPKLLRPVFKAMVKGTLYICSLRLSEIIHVSEERKNVYGYLAIPGKVVVYYPDLQPEPKPDNVDFLNQFVIVHAGALRSKYGANEILESLLLLKEKYDDIILVVLGGIAGPINHDLLLKAKKLGLLNIQSHIPYEEVVQWLMKAHVGLNIVIPADVSHYLAQPRKLYEYFSVGLPVVAADVPTIRSVLNKWKNGKAVNPYSPLAIAEAVEYYYLHPEERNIAGRNAYYSHKAELNWNAQESFFIEIFD